MYCCGHARRQTTGSVRELARKECRKPHQRAQPSFDKVSTAPRHSLSRTMHRDNYRKARATEPMLVAKMAKPVHSGIETISRSMQCQAAFMLIWHRPAGTYHVLRCMEPNGANIDWQQQPRLHRALVRFEAMRGANQPVDLAVRP